MKAPSFTPPTEKQEQYAVAHLLRLVGFWVGSTSQYRASGQALGLSDLILVHLGLARAGFFEVKGYQKQGYHPGDPTTWVPKPLSPKQEEFRQMVVACGELYGWGGIREAEIFLVDLGLAEFVGGGAVQLKRLQSPRRDVLDKSARRPPREAAGGETTSALSGDAPNAELAASVIP